MVNSCFANLTILGIKMMKRHKMGRKGWTILAIILYPFVLPILFIWFPQAVTLWLEAWHVLFGFFAGNFSIRC